jgi:hypothetical protein
MASNTKQIFPVLSVRQAIDLGDLMRNVQARNKVRWIPSTSSEPAEGTLRGIVNGPNDFNFLSWGSDVRGASVWITTKTGMERTETVEWLLKMMDEGACVFESEF